MSGPASSPSTRAPGVDDGTGNYPQVDVLLLGSGWTSAWLLPYLFSQGTSIAYTNRAGSKPEWLALPGHRPIRWTSPSSNDSHIQWRQSFKDFPIAKLVVVVMPLTDEVAAKELVAAYSAHVHDKSAGSADRPKWCILGSTGAYGKGVHGDQPVPTVPSPRSAAESALLSTFPNDVTVLSLAGLYGGDTRHPINWLSRVAGTEEKLASKSSLHLVHGRDVAEAVGGVWNQVDRRDLAATPLWGERWILTDGKTYDWWKLVLDLPITNTDERARYANWVRNLQKTHNVASLPRQFKDTAEVGTSSSPEFLDRSLSSDSFWTAVGRRPTQGTVTEVDLPISPVTKSSVSSSEAALAVHVDAPISTAGTSSKYERWTPKISKARLDDLIASLQHEINRESQFPLPAVFEGRKDRFGLTHKHFQSLRKGWLKYLTSSNAPQDTWETHWKELLSYEHYFAPVPDKLTGSYVEGTLDGLHFVRVQPPPETRAQGRRVEPLLFLHGWPGSFLEGLSVARALAHPGPDVPLSKPAFDVVIPSMPGYAWSGSPVVDEDTGNSCFSGPEGDLLVPDVADLVDSLMMSIFSDGSDSGTQPTYSITAGDWGAGVARRCATRHRQHVRATHMNYLPAPPPALSPPLVPEKVMDVASSVLPGMATLRDLPRKLGAEHFVPKASSLSDSSNTDTDSRSSSLGARLQTLLGLPAVLNEADARRVQRGMEFLATGSAYAHFHGTRPSTLGNIAHTSPSALLSWIGEKFFAWTDPRRPPADSLVFESLTLWWCTDTMARAVYPYRNRDVKDGPLTAVTRPENYIHNPTGYSMAPYELIPSPLAWSKATANIVWHREHEYGGHFLALECPNLYVGDVRDFLQGVLEESK
ncbi:unnamed protein product [Parajaminaea phylloscopi]